MKKFFKYLIIAIMLPIITIGTLGYFKPASLKTPLKKLVEYSLSNKIITTKIENITFLNGSINLSNLSIFEENDKIISIEQVNLNYNKPMSLKKLGLYFAINISNFKMGDIELDGSGEFSLRKSIKEISNFRVDFGDGAFIDCSLLYKTFLDMPYLIKSDGNVVNVPLMVQKAFWHVAPKNGAVAFLRDFILAGKVSGSWHLNLDKAFFADETLDPENFTGKLILNEVEFKYDNEFPTVKKLNSEVVLNGTNVIFNINQGYSGSILLSDSTISIDWSKGSDTEVIGKVLGKGPAVDLISFIPLENVDGMKKYDINLTTITGNTNLEVNLLIPLKAGTINKYDVTANISEVNLSIFNDSINLKNANLIGKYDGNKVTVSGKGLLNDFNSDISYEMNLDKNQNLEFDHIISAKINFNPNSKASIATIYKGNSIIDLIYKLKENHAILSITSDLKNTEFSVNKIGLYKNFNKAADLKIFGESFAGPMPEKVDISLIGSEGLKILGTLESGNDNEKKLSFSEIKYGSSNMKADLVYGSNSLKANISGSVLDLSRADMMSFLNKEADSRATDLIINISKIKMKNDIWLDDFGMKIRCDKIRCYEGAIDSKIGTRSIKMNLSADGDKEQWTISTTNAGALLKSIGLYNKMLAGNMVLNLETSRKEVHAGQQVSIMDGSFNLNKFVILDMPFLSKIASFVSLQGLIDAVKRQNKANFVTMNGVFGYKNGLISIEQSKCEGQFFDFTMKGSINTNSKVYKLKGSVVPSLYGFNAFIRKVPLIGKIFSAPYFIKDTY